MQEGSQWPLKQLLVYDSFSGMVRCSGMISLQTQASFCFLASSSNVWREFNFKASKQRFTTGTNLSELPLGEAYSDLLIIEQCLI